MTRRISPTSLLRCGVCLVVLAVGAHWAAAQARAAHRLLYPPASTVGPAGAVQIVAAVPRSGSVPVVLLDGKPVKAKRIPFDAEWRMPGLLKLTAARVGNRSATAVLVASARLAVGRHTIKVGSATASVLASPATKPPAGWSRRYTHPRIGPLAGEPGCGACHAGGNTSIGAADTPKACAMCHTDAKVQLVHKHITPPLARCAMCHDPHGSTRPKLLTDAKEKLCTRCHAAGHSKG